VKLDILCTPRAVRVPQVENRWSKSMTDWLNKILIKTIFRRLHLPVLRLHGQSRGRVAFQQAFVHGSVRAVHQGHRPRLEALSGTSEDGGSVPLRILVRST
jgi:hypothetical protein